MSGVLLTIPPAAYPPGGTYWPGFVTNYITYSGPPFYEGDTLLVDNAPLGPWFTPTDVPRSLGATGGTQAGWQDQTRTYATWQSFDVWESLDTLTSTSPPPAYFVNIAAADFDTLPSGISVQKLTFTCNIRTHFESFIGPSDGIYAVALIDRRTGAYLGIDPAGWITGTVTGGAFSGTGGYINITYLPGDPLFAPLLDAASAGQLSFVAAAVAPQDLLNNNGYFIMNPGPALAWSTGGAYWGIPR